MLAPVRESFVSGKPIPWKRVHDLPDFVYFDHSIHVNKGVGCATCHGHVDRMPLTWQANTLYMKWCLDCHKEPQKFVRPRSELFNMSWTGKTDPSERHSWSQTNHTRVASLTECGVCHR